MKEELRFINGSEIQTIPVQEDPTRSSSITVILPQELTENVDNLDFSFSIYFKEKANCRKKFTDREGVHYITSLKQEGTKQNVEQED